VTGRLDSTPEIEIARSGDLRDWLAAHHSLSAGIWAVTWKKSVPDRYVALSDVVDEALCFGWIDSLPRAKDVDRTMLYLAPRKPGSNWSRVNKNKIARLEAEGRMHSAGRAAVERAVADGSWSALDDVENLVVPPDLAAALAGVDGGRRKWEAYPRSVRRGALEQLLNARRAATRDKRVAIILAAVTAGERPFQWRKS